MKARSWFALSLCLLITCGILVSPSIAARKVPKRPVIVRPRPMVVPPPVIVKPVPRPAFMPVAPKPIPPKPPAAVINSPQFGVSAGYFASIPAAIGEIRFHDPFEFKSTSLRLGAGYAQGADSAGVTRKHALLILDGIYRMTAPGAEGLRSYFGLGANYDAYTSGRVSGNVDGQVFYGIEANVGGGQIFAEIGYGLIRTGISPVYKGLNLQVGYKM